MMNVFCSTFIHDLSFCFAAKGENSNMVTSTFIYNANIEHGEGKALTAARSKKVI